jgi:hypothetical protein
MKLSRRMGGRSTAALSLALVAVMVVATSALAGHLGEPVKSYTGCLTTSGGTLSLIKEGDSPQKPCPSGSVLAHFSGGDITKITAGTGLRITNGDGTNGEVALALDSAYTLPQGCTSGQVAKWNGTGWACGTDNDHIYTAGTGLTLSGSEFRIATNYRVLNDKSCPSGQFVRRIDGAGEIVCSVPSGSTLQSVSASAGGVGIPDDGKDHDVASVSPAAGTYLFVAKGQVTSERNVGLGSSAGCFLGSSFETQADSMGADEPTLNAVEDLPFALTGVIVVASGESVKLVCHASDGADGVGLRLAHIVGIKIG